ncbi:cysteine desulfurase family protein [Aerococcus kribbianus]|uniref:Cysteine desulfurase family protein n=1 Tax=Aerococcus kribbianus TaxID=2999064 RepID=A0A9X3JFJ1_9LACT|nr:MULTISPECIES: cysteine desulfurase family protein [unclassified Aerococcus]MCZ0717693.1 cysteine desulfurase family protein [Aerococcus sp. YH-aer221]MCZ0725981.1 cysteine desulfurase family protein [Aerococcus sp. YH-aer222]
MTEIYFDNSATTKLDSQVLKSMLTTMETYYGNPSSLHDLGNQANKLLQSARQQIADLFACQAKEIIFTSGGTESNNFALKGTAMEKGNFGRHIISSQVEHPSVRRSLEHLQRQGFDVTYLPVNKQGLVSADDLRAALRDDTILVSIMAVNNEVGAIQPIAEIGEVLNDYPSIHYHVDGVQSLGKFTDILIHPRVDLFSLSAHKFNGPRGVGILYKQANRKLSPLLDGGGQEGQLRSSTENLAGIVAMAKAMRLTMENASQENANHKQFQEKIRAYMSKNSDFKIFSAPNQAPHVFCFALRGVRGEVMVHALENEGIYASTTSACSSRATDQASSTLKAMGVAGDWASYACRLSFGSDNTMEEIDYFLQVMDKLVAKFAKIQ